MHELIIRNPDDLHVHFRSPPGLAAYARRTAALFGRAVVMPNTTPPLTDGASVSAYAAAVRAAAPSLAVVSTFKLLPGMSAGTVRECAAAGARVGKYYPAGVTTNSQDGIRDPEEIREALREMETLGLILSVHGEAPDAPLFDREKAFLPTVARLLAEYPGLKIVLEHLSTRESADFVLGGPDRLGATITAHHLAYTTDDLAGAALNPHLFCKPVLQAGAHREALRLAAGECGRIFFGSDSAPHPRERKESGAAPAGAYSAPAALSVLASVFEEEGALDRLEAFTSLRGAAFYGLEPNPGRLRLVREPWQVPEELDGAVPMAAGKKLAWTAYRV